jgi:hypothetical protein
MAKMRLWLGARRWEAYARHETRICVMVRSHTSLPCSHLSCFRNQLLTHEWPLTKSHHFFALEHDIYLHDLSPSLLLSFPISIQDIPVLSSTSSTVLSHQLLVHYQSDGQIATKVGTNIWQPKSWKTDRERLFTNSLMSRGFPKEHLEKMKLDQLCDAVEHGEAHFVENGRFHLKSAA